MNEGAVSLSHLTGILTTSYFGGGNPSIAAGTAERKQLRMIHEKNCNTGEWE